MLSSEQLTTLKAIAITEVLAALGHHPVQQLGKEYVYISPLTNERTPSFYVDPVLNRFYDHSGANDGKGKGNVVDLLCYVKGMNFREAITWLNEFKPSGTFLFRSKSYFPKAPEGKYTPIVIRSVKPLIKERLLEYVKGRAIPLSIAQHYLREVHYQNHLRNYFGIGFANDLGGYAINTTFTRPPKINIGQAAPTTIRASLSSTVCLFEGMFDFLSALVWFGLERSRHHVIVLNSLSHLRRVEPLLGQYSRIRLFLDRDTSGSKQTKRIMAFYNQASDESYIYEGFKDFNDYIKSKQ